MDENVKPMWTEHLNASSAASIQTPPIPALVEESVAPVVTKKAK